MTVTIALDAMGGDHAPEAVIDGALHAHALRPDMNLIFVGKQEIIQAELQKKNIPKGRYEICHASQVVGMGEKPALALRGKKDSSMRVGANMVKAGDVDAFVSSGNTGALMATAKYVLKTLPGIDRPAIASRMPNRSSKRGTMMLDLGANVECTTSHLCQFALMGEVYAKAVMNLSKPSVGLLNVGEEEVKGNGVVKEAAEQLKKTSRNFIGFVEGTDIFSGDVDVVVCDGFVGNISLKTAEGVAQMLVHFLKEAFKKNIWSRLAGFLARSVLQNFGQRVDHRRYNGAILLGLNGVVVKSHGGADALAFSYAVRAAADLAENQVNEKIRRKVAELRQAGEM
ncbi:phosphate acyltransferase PlsX [Magnetococcales bacterium HHB-1]